MKVSLIMYTAGGLSGGAAKYLRRMVPRLLEDKAVSDLRVLLPRGALPDFSRDWPIFEWSPGWLRGSEIRRLVAPRHPDVVFIPTARWIYPGAAASVVMLRNMEPLEATTGSRRAIDRAGRFARRLAAREACAKADRVIAVSGHVADWLQDHWSLDPAKLAVIPHGVDPAGRGSPPVAASALIGRRFVFSAGSIRPARGLTDLIEAMGRPDFPAELHLAFAGQPDPDTHDHYARLLERVARLGLEGRVHWLGQCGREQMDWGFANCDLFVMTSRAEACPNTVLEALSHGCLSVSCDTPPMPEFFGSAALYYAAGDPASLAAATVRALALNEGERDALRQAARARASGYSWDRCARDTVTVLADAAQCRGLRKKDKR